jgi:hypothetical protein
MKMRTIVSRCDAAAVLAAVDVFIRQTSSKCTTGRPHEDRRRFFDLAIRGLKRARRQ